MLSRNEIRKLFKPGDRVIFGIVWLRADGSGNRSPFQLKGVFHSWDESMRASNKAFVTLDEPCPHGPQKGQTFVNVDFRELTLINALERLAEET